MEKFQDEVIEELVSLILMQDAEIKKLEQKVKQIAQYLDVYEEYIKKGEW